MRIWQDGCEGGGVVQGQPMEGLLGIAKGLELYPEGKVETLKDVSVTCIANTLPPLILDCMLKLTRIPPHCHLLAMRLWAYVIHMPWASISSSVQWGFNGTYLIGLE